MTEAETKTRIELAALYRIADILGWSDNIFTHITAKVPDEDAFLIISFGLLFEEVTASNLVKVSLSGEKLSAGKVNDVALMLHTVLYKNRPDINCIIHTHTTTGVAVSASKDGLLPISQQSITIFNDVSYHNYEGVFFWSDEQDRLLENLGDKDILILKNHGLVTTASNIPSCFSRMYMLESACAIQVSAHHNPLLIDTATINRSVDASLKGTNHKSTILMWRAMKRKLDRLCPDYIN